MRLDLVSTLSELVSIPSVNPMGRDVDGPEYREHQVTDYLEQLFDRLGLPWRRQRVEPKRENIVARVDGDPSLGGEGALLLLEAHQDTVPVDGMTIEPWRATVRDGRIYGRGACDIKGGMTAMLGALARVAEERPPGMPTVVMACTVNEEHGYTGASALTELWKAKGDSILPRRPDAAIVAEPTELKVVVAHKGAVRWRIRTSGEAGHSSSPNPDANAIYKMAQTIRGLEEFQRTVLARRDAHPLCGPPTLSVGTIRGGLSVNTVPDACVIEVDRRILPGEQSDVVYREVIEFLASRSGSIRGIEHESPFLDGRSLADGPNQDLARKLTEASNTVFEGCEEIGVPFGTDAATLAAAGVPTVVFGPGSIQQAHTADEWLSVEQLELACEALYQFMARGI